MKKTNKILVIILILLLTITASFTYARYYSSYSATISLNIREPRYTISFNANGGSGTMQNQTFSYGTNQNLTANGFTYDGHIFDGWNTSQDGSGTFYANEEEIGNLTTQDNVNIPLYAQWHLDINYNITYTGIPSTGLPTSVAAGGTTTINFGSEVVVPVVTMGGIKTKNYTFDETNNILTIPNVTGDVNILGAVITSDIELVVTLDNKTYEETFTGSNAITDVNSLVNNAHLHAINGVDAVINKIVVTHEYTITNGGDKTMTAILSYGNNQTKTQTMTYKKKQPTPVVYTFDGLSINPAEIFSVTFEVGSSNNGVISLTKQTIEVFLENGS